MSDYPLATPQFEPIGIVGDGAWSNVWKVRDKGTGVDFAVKAFRPNELAQSQLEYRQLGNLDEIVARDYGGFGGVITFDEFGEVSKPLAIKMIKNGKFVMSDR
tara:strand:- start:812 stop:1120 length:309 start_codon:yes stop_codon:yes gene_type:complete